MGDTTQPQRTIHGPPRLLDIQTTIPDPRLLFLKNVSIPLQFSPFPIRANVYLPKQEKEPQPQPDDDQLEPKNKYRYPVLVTYGPYGKDIPYSSFHPSSFAEVNAEQRSEFSAWETPDPVYWCKQGYAVVRADERGTGQSPGLLDTMSRDTSDAFCQVIEWCADQSWSSGKVGLLGVSYYAGESFCFPQCYGAVVLKWGFVVEERE